MQVRFVVEDERGNEVGWDGVALLSRLGYRCQLDGGLGQRSPAEPRPHHVEVVKGACMAAWCCHSPSNGRGMCNRCFHPCAMSIA